MISTEWHKFFTVFSAFVMCPGNLVFKWMFYTLPCDITRKDIIIAKYVFHWTNVMIQELLQQTSIGFWHGLLFEEEHCWKNNQDEVDNTNKSSNSKNRRIWRELHVMRIGKRVLQECLQTTVPDYELSSNALQLEITIITKEYSVQSSACLLF